MKISSTNGDTRPLIDNGHKDRPPCGAARSTAEKVSRIGYCSLILSVGLKVISTFTNKNINPFVYATFVIAAIAFIVSKILPKEEPPLPKAEPQLPKAEPQLPKAKPPFSVDMEMTDSEMVEALAKSDPVSYDTFQEFCGKLLVNDRVKTVSYLIDNANETDRNKFRDVAFLKSKDQEQAELFFETRMIEGMNSPIRKKIYAKSHLSIVAFLHSNHMCRARNFFKNIPQEDRHNQFFLKVLQTGTVFAVRRILCSIKFKGSEHSFLYKHSISKLTTFDHFLQRYTNDQQISAKEAFKLGLKGFRLEPETIKDIIALKGRKAITQALRGPGLPKITDFSFNALCEKAKTDEEKARFA